MIDHARKLIDTFGKLDPGAGCWQFIQKHKPELWREHCRSLLADDLSCAATTFKQMLSAWKDRHQSEQGVLL